MHLSHLFSILLATHILPPFLPFFCHSIPFPSLCSFHSPPPHPLYSSSSLPSSVPPCVDGGCEGVWDGGKAACRTFFSPSMLTCSPAGQHILSTSVGLAGQAEPYLLLLFFLLSLFLPPSLPWLIHWSDSAGVGASDVVEGGRHFHIGSHFPAVSPSCIFQVLSLRRS